MTIENVLAQHEDGLLEDYICEETSQEIDVDKTELKVTELSLVPINPSESEEDQMAESPITNIEEIIKKLPENFPLALPIIQTEVAPLIAKCEPALIEHFIPLLKKQTKASNVKVIKDVIENAKQKFQMKESGEIADDEIDPEILEMVEQIKNDPLLFKKRMDVIAKLGVVGEQNVIALNFLVMDSRLLPMGIAGSEALALKNCGIYGAGKSYPLFMCKELYSSSAYHLITSGSSKSLYNIEGGLKNKVLILTEALSLQADNSRADNELAYAIRSLISEGSLVYQYTGYNEDGKKVTIITKLEGPTSLLTTTIHGRLEPQLEDRLISVSPDITTKQTQDILEKTANLANGHTDSVDDNSIKSWRIFHDALESIEVIIPFAQDIVDFVKRTDSLPVAARRGFKRILAGIKTIALVYQYQREQDDQGRVIAEMVDYFLASQLLDESFRKSLGQTKTYTNKRLKIIEREGLITSGNLAEMAGVSAAALSQWIKKRIEKGELIWTDKNGCEFEDEQCLQKAKHSGNAFLRIANPCGLPTPFQLTEEPRWREGGEFFMKYDLKIGSEADEESIEGELDFSDLDFEVENINDTRSGVKVFRQKKTFENNFLKDQDEQSEDIGETLVSEFEQILSPMSKMDSILVTTA